MYLQFLWIKKIDSLLYRKRTVKVDDIKVNSFGTLKNTFRTEMGQIKNSFSKSESEKKFLDSLCYLASYYNYL